MNEYVKNLPIRADISGVCATVLASLAIIAATYLTATSMACGYEVTINKEHGIAIRPSEHKLGNRKPLLKANQILPETIDPELY